MDNLFTAWASLVAALRSSLLSNLERFAFVSSSDSDTQAWLSWSPATKQVWCHWIMTREQSPCTTQTFLEGLGAAHCAAHPCIFTL
jgi:hypothetical protein